MERVYSDFIILSEFCEISGATVLQHIPQSIPDFDSDSFVKRILASDHTRVIDGGNFFSEWSNQDDTQISLKHHDYHCYIHYLTLHDVDARGYARPFCIAYLSRDESKILKNFELFLRGFIKISYCLRFGNNLKFLIDIGGRINRLLEHEEEDVDLKKETLKACKHDIETLFGKFESFEDTFKDSVNAFKNLYLLGGSFGTLDSEFVSLYKTGLANLSLLAKRTIPLILKVTHKPLGFGEKLRHIDQLCGANYVYSREMMKNIISFFDKPSFVLDIEKIDLYTVYQDILPSSLYLGKSILSNLNWFDEDEEKSDLDLHLVENLDKNRTNRVEAIQNNLIKSFMSAVFPSCDIFPGKGILKVVTEYRPFIFHLVYSILKGRPVLIYGNPEHQDAITNIITALSIFVPGRFWIIEKEKNGNNEYPNDKSFGIVQWSTLGIKNTDLSFVKIIGLSKTVAIQKSLQRYLTIWDYETKTLISPRYNGGFLDPIFTSKRKWPDEDTYLARLHVFFSEIGAKVALLYNISLLFLDEQVTKQKITFSTDGLPNRIEEFKDIQKQMHLSQSDLEIVDYLVEVIKEQQTRELCPMTMSVRLDFTPCYSFTA